MLASPSPRPTQSTSLLPVTHPHPNNRLLGNLEGCRPTVPLPLLYPPRGSGLRACDVADTYFVSVYGWPVNTPTQGGLIHRE